MLVLRVGILVGSGSVSVGVLYKVHAPLLPLNARVITHTISVPQIVLYLLTYSTDQCQFPAESASPRLVAVLG